MGRLLGKEDFIDTFGVNLTRGEPPKRKLRGQVDNGDYTPEELQIFREFENLLRGSTLDDDSDFKKKLKELAEKRLKEPKPKKEK